MDHLLDHSLLREPAFLRQLIDQSIEIGRIRRMRRKLPVKLGPRMLPPREES
jgi:hypothetical protein